MEYNQNSRNPQAANQSQQQSRENISGQKQPQSANPRQNQNPSQEQQGLGKKSQGGSNPYNKPFNPKQQQQPGKNQNIPPR